MTTTEGRYSVLRYIPDPARNEALNIGILAWSASEWRIAIDDGAIARVVRENPQLEREALLYVEPMLRERLRAHGSAVTAIHSFLTEQSGFPVVISDPRVTHVDRDLDTTTDRLLTRIVRLRRRSGGGAPNLVEAVAKEVRPLLRSRAVEQHRPVVGKISGIPRVVDFFANHNNNVALDVVRLAVRQADEVKKRADAEAFKIYDIIQGPEVTEFFALCFFSAENALLKTNQQARQVIEAAGAHVVTEVEEAARALGTVRLDLRPDEA